MRITLLDTGAGNLHSLEKAFVRALPGASVTVEEQASRALATDLLVLPGVGAFASAAEKIREARIELRDALLAGLPCIGICLGMQLLFTESEEGLGLGLDVVPGRVTRLVTPRAPHMGWSHVGSSDPSLSTALPRDVYYAHSYACRPTDPAMAVAFTEIPGDRFAAMVRRGRTVGCQFHPEKSSAAGVAFLGWLSREVTS